MGESVVALPFPVVLWRAVPEFVMSDVEFEQFFIANYDSVVRSVTLITGDRERAVDATQVAFIKAYARWSKIRSLDMPAAWVRRAAINAGRDSHRAERRRRNRERPHVDDPTQSPADDVVSADFAASLLAQLSDRQREVATLFYVDDLGVRDIAGILNVSEGTVKSHLSEARDRMRDVLQRGEVSS